MKPDTKDYLFDVVMLVCFAAGIVCTVVGGVVIVSMIWGLVS